MNSYSTGQQLWEEEVQNFRDLCDMIGVSRSLNPCTPDTHTWNIPFTENNLKKLSNFFGESVKHIQADGLGVSYIKEYGSGKSSKRYGLEYSANGLICYCIG